MIPVPKRIHDCVQQNWIKGKNVEVAFKYIYVLIDAWLVMAFIEYANAVIYDEHKKVGRYCFSDFVNY